MQIIQMNVADIFPDPNNARFHNTSNIDAIKGSLTKFGQQKPIVVNAKNIVIAGNGTLQAAIALGWESVNVVVTELDDLNQMAFGLADNRTAELASWDDSVLGPLLTTLRGLEFDLTGIGFDTSYLDNINKQLDPTSKEGAKELGEGEFSEFDHKCPKCGFEYDAAK